MKTIASPCTLFPQITFQDTNVVGNVYFLAYFRWQLECFDEWFRYAFPARWRAIRQGECPGQVSSCFLKFRDPVGATLGDRIRVNGSVEEQFDGTFEMSMEVSKLFEIESAQIASGSVVWTPLDFPVSKSVNKPVGPCYSVSVPVPGGWRVNPIDLLSWQGKCRELFLADHAPEMLHLVAKRRLALQTSTVSTKILATPQCPVEEVRVELRLETIKRGQMGVKFDYFAESECGSARIAEGTQRMSCKKWNGSSLVPCVFRQDLVEALGRFAYSERLREKIDDILDFLRESRSDTTSVPISNPVSL